MMSGHFAAVYQDWLWVFPGPRNHNMRRVSCCNLMQYHWEERAVLGEPPTNAHARRGLDCFVDGRRLIVFGKRIALKGIRAEQAFLSVLLLRVDRPQISLVPGRYY